MGRGRRGEPRPTDIPRLSKLCQRGRPCPATLSLDLRGRVWVVVWGSEAERHQVFEKASTAFTSLDIYNQRRQDRHLIFGTMGLNLAEESGELVQFGVVPRNVTAHAGFEENFVIRGCAVLRNIGQNLDAAFDMQMPHALPQECFDFNMIGCIARVSSDAL